MNTISFFSKEPLICPCCENRFKREILRTGGGRLNAGDLGRDLHRFYNSSSKYGLVNPLIYHILVCPSCWYAANPEDFFEIKEREKQEIPQTTNRRKTYVREILGDRIDFEESRSLVSGAASFFLALSCYSHFPSHFAPTIKRAISAVRGSWLIQDLSSKEDQDGSEQSLKSIYWYLRKLAWKLYEKGIRHAETGKESFDQVTKLGPDLDTDYRYDGVLYMMCYLGLELGDFLEEKEKVEKFAHYRTQIAHVFGFGKSSKEKPSSLLNLARDLHTELGEAIQQLESKQELSPSV